MRSGEVSLLSSTPAPFIASSTRFYPVHGDSAQQLGIEIRRFLGQDLARRGNAHHLIDFARIQQKRDLARSAVHGIQLFRRRRQKREPPRQTMAPDTGAQPAMKNRAGWLRRDAWAE